MSNLPQIILSFNDVNRSDIAKAGGKGANLGELTQLGVPVPTGFIVSAEAYYYFLDMSNLDQKIQDILSHTDIENNSELNKASSIIEELFLRTKLPPVLEHEVSKAYSKLSGFSDVLVAVRSSATAEDLPDASFAGQQRTYLNIKGKKEVMLAMKAAWASLFEPRAIYYRHTKGYDHHKVGIAVPIQKMIQSEVSGVMFTLNPVTNDLTKITIESVLGLGEAIVSGEITPDHYSLDKESLSIIEKNIANQEWMLVRKPNAKSIDELNQKVPVSPKWQRSQKLDDRSLITLANIGRVVESHYGFPQDIEWAIEKGKLWVIQSRPVSTIKMNDEEKSFEDKIAKEIEKVQEEQHKVIPDVMNLNPHAHNVPDTSMNPQLTSDVIIPPAPIAPVITPHIETTMPFSGISVGEADNSMINDVPKTPHHTAHHHVEQKINETNESFSSPSLHQDLTVLLSGSPASTGIVSGKVKILLNISNIEDLNKGDILVTEVTNPSWLPILQKAAAVVTNFGGSTSHAAIIARELGIPAVVGTQIATRILKDGEYITVDGTKGIVYEGGDEDASKMNKGEESNIRIEKFHEEPASSVPFSSMSGISSVGSNIHSGSLGLTQVKNEDLIHTPPAINKKVRTATKVYINLADPDLAEEVAKLDSDGVGLLRAEFMIASNGVHPQQIIEDKKQNEYVEYLASNIAKVCKAFNGRTVLYRFNNFTTSELRGLKGGDKYEHSEENPMLGYRGALRYLNNPEEFGMELEAVKTVRNKLGFKNLSVAIPFVRTVKELREVKKLIAAAGLKRSSTFKIHMLVEIPSNVLMIEEFLQIGVDGVTIGASELTQLTLGLDKNNKKLEFDEKDASMMWSYEKVIKACHQNKVVCTFDGEAVAKYPDLTDHLVKMGITGVSLNPDTVEVAKESIYEVEKALILRKLK